MRRVRSLVPALLILVPALAGAQPGPVVFLGSQVSPLGSATLSVGPGPTGAGAAALTSNRLYVGNLSFSGSDGFRVQTGGGTGGLVGFLDEAASFPVGGGMDCRVIDPAGYTPCVRIDRIAGGALVDPDFSALGAPGYRAEVWNDGVPVSGFDGLTGALMAAGFPARFLVDLRGVTSRLADPPMLPAPAPFPLSNSFQLQWGTDVAFSNGGSPLATGDELRLYPGGGAALAAVMSIDVLVTTPIGAPAYTMSIDDLAIQQFGRMHRGSGGAIIVASLDGGGPVAPGRRAALSNHSDMILQVAAGVPGGIQVDLHPSQSRDILIYDIQDGFVTGDQEVFSVTGELVTGGPGEVGKATSVYTGSGWSITPDFGGSGSPDARVEVFDASGNLVGLDPCIVGPFTVASAYRPIHTGVDSREKLAIEFRYDAPVIVDLPAGSFSGTSVRMMSNTTIRPRLMYTISNGFIVASTAEFRVKDVASAFGVEPEPFHLEFESLGSPYLKRVHGGIVVDEIDASGNDGVQILPCILPDLVPPAQFGVEWAPLGPPGATMGQTDWAFLSKLATDAAPVERIGVSMLSNGAAVQVFKGPGPVGSPDVRVVLRSGAEVMADFVHSGSATPFAELPDWPVAVGYRELSYPDQPWSMWIGLGYEMDVMIPGGPTLAGASTAFPLTKADLIEVIAIDTPNPGSSEKRVIASRFYGLGHIVIHDRYTGPVGVGHAPRPRKTALRPAYPNPFNPRTTLSFELAETGRVSLKIYAIDGGHVATVHEGVLAAGPHAYEWNGTNHRGQPVASGVYVAELRAPDGARHTKVNLLK
jgi:hypothetical protein